VDGCHWNFRLPISKEDEPVISDESVRPLVPVQSIRQSGRSQCLDKAKGALSEAIQAYGGPRT
jgi:hypothetical protein